LNGLTAKTVPRASQKIQPEPKEVVVSVVWKRRPIQISIDPSYLEPWMPSEGNKVLIIRNRWIGQVGKLTLLVHGECNIKLESGELVFVKVEDVVNVLNG
jgi:hypothetical protein